MIDELPGPRVPMRDLFGEGDDELPLLQREYNDDLIDAWRLLGCTWSAAPPVKATSLRSPEEKFMQEFYDIASRINAEIKPDR